MHALTFKGKALPANKHVWRRREVQAGAGARKSSTGVKFDKLTRRCGGGVECVCVGGKVGEGGGPGEQRRKRQMDFRRRSHR